MSFDDVETNRAFAEKHGFPYPLLCDTSKSMSIAYRAAADASASYPQRITYIVDPQGAICYAARVTDIAAHLDDVAARMVA